MKNKLFGRLSTNIPLEEVVELRIMQNEEMIKLRVERGDIPIKGDICVKAKLQSKFQ
jgi:hypothetical protein